MTDFLKQQHPYFNFKQFILNALNEDLGSGDHTSLATIKNNQKGKMQLLAKQNGIIAGVSAANKIFSLIDKTSKIKFIKYDGDLIFKGDVIFEISGNLQKMLRCERLVLNIMQRMSGIATKTAFFQKLCNGTKTKVIDTRKTTPGFRFFEKWAVFIGGGSNHRFGLFDMILIKDNHIDFIGGIEKAIEAANIYQKKNNLNLCIEVETRSINDVKKVIKCGGVQRIMLDNFSIKKTKQAVKLINNAFQIESSGGINEKNINSYAKCGPDFISVGALTHQIKSLDLSLKAIN